MYSLKSLSLKKYQKAKKPLEYHYQPWSGLAQALHILEHMHRDNNCDLKHLTLEKTENTDLSLNSGLILTAEQKMKA